MLKRNLNTFLMGSAIIVVMLLSAWNVTAYGQSKAVEVTDKSDRTMIKEILADQKTIIALLNEIKAGL